MSFVWALVVIGLAGLISLSYEILWFRVFSFVSGSHPVIFGLLLAAYLFGLALGAVVGRAVATAPRAQAGRRQLRVVAGALFVAGIAGYLVVPGLAWLATLGVWPAGFALVLVAAAMFGLIFPVISHLGIAPEEAVGARVSYLYVSSIVGSAAGSLLTGFVLTDVWSTEGIMRALAIASMCLGGVVAVYADRAAARGGEARAGARAWLGSVVAATLIAMVLLTEGPLFARLYERLLFKRDAAHAPDFRRRVESRAGVVALAADSAVYGGGVYDGFLLVDLLHDRNMLVRTYAIGALHPHPARVLNIGLATGASTAVLARLPGVERVTAIEINPGYLEIIADEPQVSWLLRDPHVSIVIDDGRRWLMRNPEEKFDAIVMNTTWHWRAHSTNLLSAEFLDLARRHLRPGGILLFNATGSPDALKTAFTEFPYGMRVVNFVAVSDSAFQFDLERWSRVLASVQRTDGRPLFESDDAHVRARLDSLLAFPRSLDEPPRYYGLERRESVLRNVAHAQLITDDNMVPEFRATRPTYSPWQR